MSVRRRFFPAGWYPAKRSEIEETIKEWNDMLTIDIKPSAVSAIAPHAGWHYSGLHAWKAWLAAAPADSVVLVGGHLSEGAGYMYYPEHAFETPLGDIRADGDLVSFLVRETGAVPDTHADNTVEVHLPMLAARFPGVPVACVRAPNDESAVVLGDALARYATETKRSIFVMGSTDLTHYGTVYDFMPAGPPPAGFAWARRANDAIIRTFLDMDAAAALRRANLDRSACSVGAAMASISYALRTGASQATLLAKGSSDETSRGSDASVGYCSIAYHA
jgi:AmmeMemoRadiSam system protein B